MRLKTVKLQTLTITSKKILIKIKKISFNRNQISEQKRVI
jgi:hypothetical protein